MTTCLIVDDEPFSVEALKSYALEGYQNDVIDYLMKPISFEKFLKAAQKAEKLIELERNQIGNKVTGKSSNTNNEDFIFVKTEHKGKYIKIKFEDILMIEGSGNYVTIYTLQQEKIIVLLTFKYLEDHLPQTQFIRTHKSYIVAFKAISGLDGNTVILGDLSVPIGVTYRENILNHFSGKMI